MSLSVRESHEPADAKAAIEMSNLDLNLLRVFDAVLRERNVLRASEAINLSPSAVSHALSRLRGFFNDDLFVRTVAGMEPTTRALEMAPLVCDALVIIDRAVGPKRFDPGSTDRQFCKRRRTT